MSNTPTVPRFALLFLLVVFAATTSAADPPRIVSITPAIGATEVDPATTEIRVTFDRDMSGGMSWTGGGEQFPETTGQATWADNRTCVLPVNLQPGKIYSLGINSQSYRNFQSAEGIPAPITPVYFATSGGSIPAGYFDPPKIVSFTPEQGAMEVASGGQVLSVTFDRPMQGGMSWVTLEESTPKILEAPNWSDDMKTCTAKAQLLPGTTHKIGLNSAKFGNFRSKANVPLEPVIWTFQTATE